MTTTTKSSRSSGSITRLSTQGSRTNPAMTIVGGSNTGFHQMMSHNKDPSTMGEMDGEEDMDELRDMSSTENAEVYMSMVWHMGHLGVAHYDMVTLQIHVMPDTPENDDFSLVKQVVHQIRPTVIVMSAVQDSRLLACIKKTSSELNPSTPGSKTESCKMEFLPNADFNHEVSKRRIFSMNLPSMSKDLLEEERKLYFSSLIPLDATNMIRSVGGLLKYLDKKRVGIELEDSSVRVPIMGFRTFSLEQIIQIDSLTYTALNIFHMELHPSGFKYGASGSKEGLSLFGILNRCKSSIGSRMLRQWFTRPVKNASVLSQRHDAVAFFMAPCNLEVVACLQGCLKNVKHIPKVLHRMSKAQATVGDWVSFSKTICHAVSIGKVCKAQKQDIEIFRKISMNFSDELERCATLISRTVDFEESRNKKRFVVLPNVNETLDEKRRTFDGMPQLMFEVAQAEIEQLSADVPHCMVSYIPQVGYLLVIDMPEGTTESDDHAIEGLELKFVSHNQLYYKSPRTTELDRLLGDSQVEILEIEVRIMHQLQSVVLENTQILLNVMELAAELDCLMTLAACASELSYSRPDLVQQDVIEIRDGRHPLQELCCSPFVANHTDINETSGKIKLLTGPNACGKTVYLKQVALIVFMAHIGSFVPARQARIGPVDRIFSRIKSVESVSGGQSTFMQDIVQVADALRYATSSSLVVIDEFGKGTESTDGLSLLTAVLKYWLAKDKDCPLALVSTHFHSIIQQKLLPPRSNIQFLTLDTVFNGEDLIFLYQIKPGHSSMSYACNIASQVGMEEKIIQRGKLVSQLLNQHKPVPHIEDINIAARNRGYDKIVSGFLQLNLKTDNLTDFLENFVLPVSEEHHKNGSSERREDTEGAQQVPQLSVSNSETQDNGRTLPLQQSTATTTTMDGDKRAQDTQILSTERDSNPPSQSNCIDKNTSVVPESRGTSTVIVTTASGPLPCSTEDTQNVQKQNNVQTVSSTQQVTNAGDNNAEMLLSKSTITNVATTSSTNNTHHPPCIDTLAKSSNIPTPPSTKCDIPTTLSNTSGQRAKAQANAGLDKSNTSAQSDIKRSTEISSHTNPFNGNPSHSDTNATTSFTTHTIPTKTKSFLTYRKPSSVLERFEKTPLLNKAKASERNKTFKCPGLQTNPSPGDSSQDRNVSKRKLDLALSNLGGPKLSKLDEKRRTLQDFSFLTPTVVKKERPNHTPGYPTTEATTDHSGGNGTSTDHHCPETSTSCGQTSDAGTSTS